MQLLFLDHLVILNRVVLDDLCAKMGVFGHFWEACKLLILKVNSFCVLIERLVENWV